MTREDFVELVKDGKRYREKRGKWEQFWIGLAVRIVTGLIDGWLLMLGVGIIHDHWWPMVPTIGYWWAAIVATIAASIFGKSSRKDKS